MYREKKFYHCETSSSTLKHDRSFREWQSKSGNKNKTTASIVKSERRKEEGGLSGRVATPVHFRTRKFQPRLLIRQTSRGWSIARGKGGGGTVEERLEPRLCWWRATDLPLDKSKVPALLITSHLPQPPGLRPRLSASSLLSIRDLHRLYQLARSLPRFIFRSRLKSARTVVACPWEIEIDTTSGRRWR